MKPVGHVVAGGILGGIGLVFVGWTVAIGAFLGSLLPDFDHIPSHWRIDPKSVFSFSKSLRIAEMLYRQHAQKPWLELAFLHTIEFFFFIFLLALIFHSAFFWAILGAMLLHAFLDYLSIATRLEPLSLRCWSVIQYFVRKHRGEKTYFNLWPRGGGP
ncbi:MAG: hypothetical protein V1845_00230 [bacterium]